MTKKAIYRLWHNISPSGRVGYIGKDEYFPRRAHLSWRTKQKSCPKLYRALRKYPLNVWQVEVLASGFKTSKSLSEAERFYIKKFDSRRKGYNCTDGGEGALGHEVSLQTRKKMSDANIGKRHSVETRKKMSEVRKGRKPTLQHRQNNSAALIGRVFSEEHRINLSKAKKGTTHSADTRKKMSESRKGVPWSEARRKAYIESVNR